MMQQLILPVPELPEGAALTALKSMHDRLLGLSDSLLNQVFMGTFVGLEVRQALLMIQAGRADAKIRALLFRPAVEPILLLHGAKVWRPEFSQIDALHIACALSGRTLGYRTERCFGRSQDGEVEFESPERVPLWLPAIKSVLGDEAMCHAASALVFARTVTSHPMTDANGRLARYLAHAAFLRNPDQPLAPVALAPTFYARRQEMAQSLTRLCQTGDWQDYYLAFASLVGEACQQGEGARGV